MGAGDGWVVLGIVAVLLAFVATGRRAQRVQTKQDRPVPQAGRRSVPTPVPSPATPVRTPLSAAGRQIVGSAWVIDGDTIVIGGVKLRLWGIDAPELDEP